MKFDTVLLIGGSGFIGSHLANRLADRGVRVLIPTRRRARARDLFLLPTVEVIEADVGDPAQLARLVSGVDAVVNLAGILHSRSGKPYGPGFAAVHAELPRKIVAACRAGGVARLIQISALGAAPDAPSGYLRSKAAGEAAIRESGDALDWTILRPSVVFGPGDRFLNLFASVARLAPVFPLAGANARFQPVFVGDVSSAILHALDHGAGIGQTLDLAGPRIYTLAELVRYAAALTGHHPLVVPLPGMLAWLQAVVLECLPNPLMSRDNLLSMARDNVARAEPLPFGLAPTTLESTAPGWLGNDTPRARYYSIRSKAGRA